MLYDTWRSKPEWSVHREGSHGFGIFEIEKNSLKYQYLRINNTIGDEFILNKN